MRGADVGRFDLSLVNLRAGRVDGIFAGGIRKIGGAVLSEARGILKIDELDGADGFPVLANVAIARDVPTAVMCRL